MTVNEVVVAIENRLPKNQAEDFDNVGLLCGKKEREVSGILISHDTTEAVVDEAINNNCNFILSFHPIIFSGLKSITGKNYVEKTIIKAIENKIAIYAVHTVFDNDYFGVNFGICQKLQLSNQQILLPKHNALQRLEVYVPQSHCEQVKNALFGAGAGKIGFYDECAFTVAGSGTFRPLDGANPFLGKVGARETADESMISLVFQRHKSGEIIRAMKAAHPYEEVAYQITDLQNENHYEGLGRIGLLPEPMDNTAFLQFVKTVFSLKVIRHSDFPDKKISRVGVLGGSGASAIAAAKAAGCDAFLCGDIKYHDFFQAEQKMLICDIGHFESEQFVVEQLFEVLSEIFPKFAILKSVVQTNPVNYFV